MPTKEIDHFDKKVLNNRCLKQEKADKNDFLANIFLLKKYKEKVM